MKIHVSRRLTICAALLCLLAGCAPARTAAVPLTRFRISFVGHLDTVVNLTAYCPDQATFDRVSEQVEAELARLSLLFDRYRPESALARLNAAAGEPEGREAAPELRELLSWCLEKQKAVGGVNVAMGGVLSLWHTARLDGMPPTESALAQAMRHISPDTVRLEGNRVILQDPAQSIDFGAVAKGYVADKLAALLRSRGVSVFLLDCGTSTLVCAGTPPDKDGWQVALRHPDAFLNLSGRANPPEQLGTLSLSARCVGVSGDYQKYFTYNGTYYGHILSSETGRPARHYRMVCVLADDALTADYYSTALFTLPVAASRQAAQTAGLDALWMLPDGSVLTTDGFPSFD